MIADKHDWNELGNYLFLHGLHLQGFVEEGFVVHNQVRESSLFNRNELVSVTLAGRLICEHGLFVDVEKNLEVAERDGKPWVRIDDCKYHAGVLGDVARPVFRYDTSHPYRGHADKYHKHLYNHETWEEIDIPVWIGRHAWPHLSDVLEELQEWWLSTGQYLDL